VENKHKSFTLPNFLEPHLISLAQLDFAFKQIQIMKKFKWCSFGLLLISSLSARDFRPESWSENITITGGAVLQCHVFQTVPGIEYRVEASNDLTSWTQTDELYGLGHQYVVAMRELIPAPPPDPEAPPVEVPGPTENASIRMQPSAASAGGTIISWASLDHGGPMIHHIAGVMDPAWESIPLFVDRYGDFNFFITLPSIELDPPEFNSPLGPKDLAMIETLEDNLVAMNQQVAASSAAARNAPPPPPSNPNAAKFWRIQCDWSIDTDQDGTPDWMEFEIGTWTNGGPTHPLRADAFQGDTNNNGIPDGEELDYDKDGVPDAKDVGKGDSSATFEIGPIPRFALFPITNASPPAEWPLPIQINDMGTVLYSNGSWTGGIWTPLQGAANRGDIGVVVQAFAINDSGEIVGHHTGMLDASGNPIPSHTLAGNLAYWSAPHVSCVPLAVGTDFPWIGGVQQTYPGPYRSNYLSNDGCLIGLRETLTSSPETGTTVERPGDRWLWTLPGLGRTPGKIPVSFDEGGVTDASLYWGFVSNPGENPQQTIMSGAGQINPPGTIHNLNRGPLGELIASFKYDKNTQVWKNGGWYDSPTYAQSIDISEDGTAIGKAHDGMNAPIFLNGKWTDMKRSSPGILGGWNDGSVTNLDTTPGGWILSRRETNLAPDELEHAIMLPLKGECLYVQESQPGVTTKKYTGVDDFSIGAIFTSPSVQDRIWIMAPKGGTPKSITFTTPVDGVHPLVLSASSVDFGNVDKKGYLYSRASTVTLAATVDSESGADIAVDIHFDTIASLSKPLGV
jgi:hypothetical protein